MSHSIYKPVYVTAQYTDFFSPVFQPNHEHRSTPVMLTGEGVRPHVISAFDGENRVYIHTAFSQGGRTYIHMVHHRIDSGFEVFDQEYVRDDWHEKALQHNPSIRKVSQAYADIEDKLDEWWPMLPTYLRHHLKDM